MSVVLSINKLTAGQDRYYVELSGDRVDVVESVGDGVEEYYVGGSEARGEWLGAGARQLGLSGDVEGQALRRALASEDPAGRVLRASRVPVRVVGFDLTFSAPKSVSVVFGLGERDVRAAVRRAHDRAVREALGYVERTASAVRRGAGGSRVEPADGLIVAAFRHRTSRAGDPQLHTHCLVANLAKGPDGRWSTLDGRRIYAHARPASFIYQSVLRSELSRELGVRWLTVRDGIAEVAGVPKPVLRAFSRRRADIQAELDRRGTSGTRASEAAALATRRPKDRRTSAEQLAAEWRARAQELGFDRADLVRVLSTTSQARPFGDAELARVFDCLSAPTGLTRRRATFSRRDVVQALAERLPVELGISAAVVERLADRFLASDRVVPLVPAGADPETRMSFRRRDGRALPTAREEWIYSTPELLALERHLIDTAVAGQGAKAGQAGEAAVRHAIAARPTLGADQRAMIERLCLAGERVAVAVGKAGTGKTFALAAAREAWHASDRAVLGVAVARRAANQLQADAGIASTSVAALIADLDRAGGGLPRGAVLVVDEAGMIGTRHLAKLLEAVEQADGKLVLVGDHRQLPELEAGGTFRGLVRRALAVELTENRRQREVWECRALDQLRDGEPETAIAAYVERKRVHVDDVPEETRERLVADWYAASRDGDAVMVAQRRSDVADLNLRARRRLETAGRLSADELRIGDASFAVGDRVVIKRNDVRLGVTNGERGTVVAIDRDQRLVVRLGDTAIALDRDFLSTPTIHGDPPLTHGYAITCHIAQGLTVDRAFVLADERLTSELAYTALSRGRYSNYLYLTEHPERISAEFAPGSPPESSAVERFVSALGTSRATSLAIDTGQPDAVDHLAQARHELAAARAARAQLDRSHWRPGRREERERARHRESIAQERVEELRRAVAEQRHADRAFVDERSVTDLATRQRDRLIERQLDRGKTRGLEL